MTPNQTISQQIKDYAKTLGFDACGICQAEAISDIDELKLKQWLKDGYHADMRYLSNNTDKRIDPRLLAENVKSIICVALNYYPHQKQPSKSPQFAYYAYGKDYHDIMKKKLSQLYSYIQSLSSNVIGRYFTDTAPMLERYWAAKAGLGFIGKNTLLIIPTKGSYFFLGEIIINTELDYDKPMTISCGNCTRCLTACPTQALEKPYVLNANKCISYQTIENKNEISPNVIPLLSNYIYGCDICQQTCPWNRFAKPHNTMEFLPSTEFLSIDYEFLNQMTADDYRRIFKGSAVKRTKFAGLKRNLQALKNQI